LNPIVLVTSSDRENARCLKDLTVEEVVWTDELEAQLLVAVKRAEGTGLLEATAGTVEQCDHLPPKLREALALVCRSWPPMRSVAQLARACIATVPHFGSTGQQWWDEVTITRGSRTSSVGRSCSERPP